MKKYSISLASCGNAQYGQNPNEPVWGFPKNQMKQVDSIQEARQAVHDFINNEPIGTLGASQWSGGELYNNQIGKQIGRISYNGRVWDMEGNEFPKDHVCKCNNCGSRLIDENPKDEKSFYLEGNELQMVKAEDEGGVHWACPNCGTDEFLSDLP